MASINGISLKVTKTMNNSDNSTTKVGAFFVEGKKIASFLYETNVPQYENCVQVFMMHGYSEDAFYDLVAARNEEGFTMEDLVEELQWVQELESEFGRHLGSVNGGMVVLSFVGAKISMGIPLRLSGQPDEVIMKELKKTIEDRERTYGALEFYAIFRSHDDFNRGEPISLDELKK